jgi:hypothetical protein
MPGLNCCECGRVRLNIGKEHIDIPADHVVMLYAICRTVSTRW